MTFSEETLSAYADGEVDAATRAALEAALATDPQLAQRLARARALRARVRDAFTPVLEEPVPERLLAALHAAAPGPRMGNVVPLRQRPRARWSWPQWGAMAASLVVGVLLGPFLLRPSAPLETSGGRVLASGLLSRALTQQLASTQPPGAPVMIGVSFHARSGGYCRTFVLRETQLLAGLACREGPAWQVVALAESAAPGAAGGGYAQAASSLPPAVARTLDELIAGEPLDAAAETAARERGWKP
jgi:negative regulator of sigma E activity